MRETVEIDMDSFETTARRNLEHAIDRLILEAAHHRYVYERDGYNGNYQLALANENAVATLRELLRPGLGTYNNAT